jgi:hypothetical protein
MSGISEAILLGPNPQKGAKMGRYFFSEHGFGELVVLPDTRPGRDDSFHSVVRVHLTEEPWLGEQVLTEDEYPTLVADSFRVDSAAIEMINRAIGRAMGYKNYPEID